MGTLGSFLSDDSERLHDHERLHQSVLGFPGSLGTSDSGNVAVHSPLCHKTEIHLAQVEDEGRVVAESGDAASRTSPIPAHPLSRLLLQPRLTSTEPDSGLP